VSHSVGPTVLRSNVERRVGYRLVATALRTSRLEGHSRNGVSPTPISPSLFPLPTLPADLEPHARLLVHLGCHFSHRDAYS
jgi:hypothetical protein